MKKNFILCVSVLIFVIVVTKGWWMFVRNPLSKAMHTAQATIAEYTAKKDAIITQDNTAVDHQLNVNDLMTPARLSAVLTAATPQNLVLTAIKKVNSLPSKGLLQVEYEIQGEATYAQFLSLITVLKTNQGVFFESLQYTIDHYHVGHFLIHIHVYDELPR